MVIFSETYIDPQADHPLCLRPRDLRAVRYLIYLLRLTSDLSNLSREMLHIILDFASFDSKL